MSRFLTCHKITARWEGGWSNHKADPGGKTMYGITEKTYRSWRKSQGLPMKPVREISRNEAERIYRRNYWDPTVGKRNLVPGVDLAVYDAAVNSGVGRALKWLLASVGTNDHTQTVRKVCRRRLSFMQSLKIWRTFGRGWTNRVADIEVQGVKMAAAFMRKDPGAAVKPDAKAIARRELKDAHDEAKTKKRIATGTGAGAGAGGGGVAIEDPSIFADVGGWLLIGVGVAAVAIVVVLVAQARAADARKEAYRKEMLT